MTEHIPLTTTPLPVRLRVEDFLRLDGAGAFEGYGKTELIEGEVFYMNAQHRPHARAKIAMFEAVRQGLENAAPGLDVLVEATVAIPPHSAPEPDIVVTSEPDGDGPVPLSSVRLAIEIADTTQDYDLGRKADLYAEAGIPEYWVVDLSDKRVLLHANPRTDGGGYDGQLDVPFGEPLYAATIDGLTVETPNLR